MIALDASALKQPTKAKVPTPMAYASCTQFQKLVTHDAQLQDKGLPRVASVMK